MNKTTTMALIPPLKCGPEEAIRTPTEALEALRAGAVERVVELSEGVYPLDATLTLGAGDSGTLEQPVVWRAAPGARVVFTGGRAVTGLAPVTDPAVLARLQPEARAHVRVSSLVDCGIADPGRLRSRGFGRPVVPAALELFFRSEPLTLARWPNTGADARIAAAPDDALIDDAHGRQFGRVEAGFFYDSDRPAQWAPTQDMWVHGYWAWDWANSYERIASIDPVRRHILTHPPHGLRGMRPGQRIFFQNILEELDQPGEYHVDRAAGLIYVWPPENPAPGDLWASVLETPLVRCRGASHIRFERITFELTRSDAVSIEGGEGIALVDCVIRNVGNRGVVVNGGSNHRIERCTISHCGDGGIVLDGGERETMEHAGHAAVANVIHHVARWTRCYQPAITLRGVGLTAAHNLIHDHPHCAILYGGNFHQIEFNEIHHVCWETGDVGAIYAGRDWTAHGNVIRHNYIHDIGGVGLGSMGIYLDDCLSGQCVEGNLLVGLHRAVYVGGGRDNRIVGNLFIDCDPAIEIDARGLDDRPVWRRLVDEMLFRELDAGNQFSPPISERFPLLRGIEQYRDRTTTPGVPPEGNVIVNNACTGRWLLLSWGVEPGMLQVENNWTTEAGRDPGFVDRASGDLRLRADGPAGRNGFVAIPFERIGPRGFSSGTGSRHERVVQE